MIVSTNIVKTVDMSEAVIDTIDIDKNQSVEYNIKVYSENFISDSNINVTTDGVLIYDTQSGFSSNNSYPLEFNTSITNYIGELKVTPTSNNCTFYLEKKEYQSEQYAIHTQSGKKILSNEGISLDRESYESSLTIKSDDIQFYGNPNNYLNSNIFGPITTSENLLNEWESFNNADIFINENLKVISSGQNQNFAYQKIQVTPGKAYKISGFCYYIDPDNVNVKENNQYQSGDSFIRISSDLNKSEILNFQLTLISTEINQIFFPDTTEIYVKVGYGKRSVESYFNNLEIKEVVPFYTYNQNYGTYYLKWNSLNNTNLMKSNNLLKLESDNIIYNDVIIGTQLTSNQLCIAYDDGIIRVSLNGSIPQEYLINNNNKNYNLELNSSILRFSYMNEILSDLNLKKLSSG